MPVRLNMKWCLQEGLDGMNINLLQLSRDFLQEEHWLFEEDIRRRGTLLLGARVY
jgi:hypothetical protein